MKKEIKTIGILTGGGDCSGLNAVINAVVKTAILKYNLRCVGFLKGYRGLYENDYVELDLEAVSGIMHMGGTILKSSNKDNLFNFRQVNKDGKVFYSDVSDVAIENMHKIGVDALIILGGDGTLTSGRDFARKGIPVIGIPKTIDNDLPATDVTFGFYSAIDVIAESLGRIHTTAASHERIMVVEVMGRNCGWLALEGGIAGSADVILIPEIRYSLDSVEKKIRERMHRNKRFAIVVVGEGAVEQNGKQIVREVVKDSPDSIRMGGAGEYVKEQLAKRIPELEVRYTNLGYTQRGGEVSAYDRILSSRYGVAAIDLLMNGDYGRMVIFKNNKMASLTLEEVIGSGETGETSKGGAKVVDPNGEMVNTAKSMGINFGD